MDEVLALLEVSRFVTMVTAMDAMWEPSKNYLSSPQYTDLKKRVEESLSLVKAIATECDPALADAIDGGLHGGWGLSSAVSAGNELVGFLETAGKREAILSPKGPKLAASTMHRWVWGVAAQLWEDGHHPQAVQTAASSIFDANLPAKLGLQKGGKGTKPEEMVGKAFDENSPLLTIPGFTRGTQDWTNAYQGAKHLGLACAKLVRNLGTHNVTDDGVEVELLEELAMLSRFARIVDSST